MDGTRSEISLRIHDLLKVIRLSKQARPVDRAGVPVGLLGMLAEVDRLSTGCHARELAAQASLDPSTVSRAVAALVAHGLVTREPDPHDGRATVLTITDAGRTALADAIGWYDQVLAGALAGWTPEEIASFGRAMSRFTQDLCTALTHQESLEAAR